jgi:hypothetical protein
MRTLFAEPTTRNNVRMVQWDQAAFARRRSIAKGGRVRPTNQLCPVRMHGLTPGLYEGVRYVRYISPLFRNIEL